jgi:hypothetical protein
VSMQIPHPKVAARLVVALLLLSGIGLSSSMTGAQTQAHPNKGRGRTAKPRKTADAGVQSDASASPPRSTNGDAGGSEAVTQKTLDGGTKVFRFGELEIEGRLKNPQLVFFLRRVRAEFAAGDLGHRSFLRELGETRQDPNF